MQTYNLIDRYHEQYNIKGQVALRKFPYPYRAAMAISNDVDNTETIEEFMEINKFLNTVEMTSMGNGIGLDIGNSFFFYEPPSEAISYFNADPDVAKYIKRLIAEGQIDILHSYGKKADFKRVDAVSALRELNSMDTKIDVWVDHTLSIDNLGDDRTFGLGDHSDSNAYHADLTLDYGIKFAWLGRVTMIAGQSVPINIGTFASIYDSEHPVHSLMNISKELLKNVLAVYGYDKYSMHKDNDLVRIATLNDGQKIYEFMRFDNYWQGVSTGANSKGLAYAISRKTLNRLKRIGGYMVVYTHLGQNSDCIQYICRATQDSLRNLAEEFVKGNIYVTTTSKLLNYYINNKYLNWTHKYNDGNTYIYIQNVADPILGTFVPTEDDLQGITFYVPDNDKAFVFLNNNQIINITKNARDRIERESITIH